MRHHALISVLICLCILILPVKARFPPIYVGEAGRNWHSDSACPTLYNLQNYGITLLGGGLADYSVYTRPLSVTGNISKLGPYLNDKVNSIHVPSCCYLELYKDPNYGGGPPVRCFSDTSTGYSDVSSVKLIKLPYPPNFSIILFPDTQNEVNKPVIWESMPNWVVDNKNTYNIKAVIGLGDVTNSVTDFTEAVKGWNMIKDAGIIYVPIPGNSPGDLSPAWNENFGPQYFFGKNWFRGAYNDKTNAYYVTFDVGSYKYLVIALGYSPSSQELLWAQDIISANKDREVIVTTHSFLDTTSLTVEGKTIWNELVKRNKNIFLVVCGHVHPMNSYSSYKTDYGVYGNRVNELRVDYQVANNGGDGYMEILEFQPSKHKIVTKAYSSLRGIDSTGGAYTMPYATC